MSQSLSHVFTYGSNFFGLFVCLSVCVCVCLIVCLPIHQLFVSLFSQFCLIFQPYFCIIFCSITMAFPIFYKEEIKLVILFCSLVFLVADYPTFHNTTHDLLHNAVLTFQAFSCILKRCIWQKQPYQDVLRKNNTFWLILYDSPWYCMSKK